MELFRLSVMVEVEVELLGLELQLVLRLVKKGIQSGSVQMGTRVPEGPPPADESMLPPIPPIPTAAACGRDQFCQQFVWHMWVKAMCEQWSMVTCCGTPRVTEKLGMNCWQLAKQNKCGLSGRGPVSQNCFQSGISSYWLRFNNLDTANGGFEGKLGFMLRNGTCICCQSSDLWWSSPIWWMWRSVSSWSGLAWWKWGRICSWSGLQGGSLSTWRCSGWVYAWGSSWKWSGLRIAWSRSSWRSGSASTSCTTLRRSGSAVVWRSSWTRRAQHVHGDFLKVIGLSTCMVIYLNLIGLCMVVLWRSLGLHGLQQDGRLHGGAPGQGTMGVAPMPASWESSGGGSGGKTELPSLPNGASPLEFGHWLYLYGPIMGDLPHVAWRWWDATVRRAHAFYLEWKGLCSLQRVQLCPRLPDELLESCFTRTEQRGVTLLLRAVRWAQSNSKSWWWIEISAARQFSSTSTLDINLVGLEKNPSSWGSSQLCRRCLRCKSWLRLWGPGGDTLQGLVKLMQAYLMECFSSRRLKLRLSKLPRRTLKQHSGFQQADNNLPLTNVQRNSQSWALVNVCWLKQRRWVCWRLLLQRPPMRAHQCASNRWMRKHHKLHLKSQALLPAMATSPEKDKPFQCQSNHASFFRSDTGCKAGRSCKWSRSSDGVEDKNSRCWICCGKDHRKSNCKIKGNGNKPSSNESGLGGGRGGNQNAANKAVVKQASVGKGHDGSATSSTTDATTSQPSAGGPGLGAEGNGALSIVQPRRWKRGELQLAVVWPRNYWRKPLSCWSLCVCPTWRWCDGQALSHMLKWCCWAGATHGLRPAASEEEWQSAESTQVMLADGVTESLRLKPGTKVLLSDPLLSPAAASWIVPMGSLNELNHKLEWKDHMCHLFTKSGDKIDVELLNGCPCVAHDLGARLLIVLEQHQLQQELKKKPWSRSWLWVPPVLAITWASKWQCLSSSRKWCRPCLMIWRWSWSQIFQCSRTPTSAWSFHGIAESERDSWWQRMWSSTCTVDLMPSIGSCD